MFGKRKKKKQVTLGLRLHHASARSGSLGPMTKLRKQGNLAVPYACLAVTLN